MLRVGESGLFSQIPQVTASLGMTTTVGVHHNVLLDLVRSMIAPGELYLPGGRAFSFSDAYFDVGTLRTLNAEFIRRSQYGGVADETLRAIELGQDFKSKMTVSTDKQDVIKLTGVSAGEAGLAYRYVDSLRPLQVHESAFIHRLVRSKPFRCDSPLSPSIISDYLVANGLPLKFFRKQADDSTARTVYKDGALFSEIDDGTYDTFNFFEYFKSLVRLAEVSKDVAQRFAGNFEDQFSVREAVAKAGVVALYVSWLNASPKLMMGSWALSQMEGIMQSLMSSENVRSDTPGYVSSQLAESFARARSLISSVPLPSYARSIVSSHKRGSLSTFGTDVQMLLHCPTEWASMLPSYVKGYSELSPSKQATVRLTASSVLGASSGVMTRTEAYRSLTTSILSQTLAELGTMVERAVEEAEDLKSFALWPDVSSAFGRLNSDLPSLNFSNYDSGVTIITGSKMGRSGSWPEFTNTSFARPIAYSKTQRFPVTFGSYNCPLAQEKPSDLTAIADFTDLGTSNSAYVRKDHNSWFSYETLTKPIEDPLLYIKRGLGAPAHYIPVQADKASVIPFVFGRLNELLLTGVVKYEETKQSDNYLQATDPFFSARLKEGGYDAILRWTIPFTAPNWLESEEVAAALGVSTKPEEKLTFADRMWNAYDEQRETLYQAGSIAFYDHIIGSSEAVEYLDASITSRSTIVVCPGAQLLAVVDGMTVTLTVPHRFREDDWKVSHPAISGLSFVRE